MHQGFAGWFLFVGQLLGYPRRFRTPGFRDLCVGLVNLSGFAQFSPRPAVQLTDQVKSEQKRDQSKHEKQNPRRDARDQADEGKCRAIAADPSGAHASVYTADGIVEKRGKRTK